MNSLSFHLVQKTPVRSALPSDTRLLSLNELRNLGSIQEAEAHLISKEVESVIREDLEGQLDYFAKRLKVDLTPLHESIPEITEAFQRRNILVHNNGIVNNIYLSRVDKSLVERYGLKAGSSVTVDFGYLRDAIECLFLVGTVVLQKCWRKWKDDSREAADRRIIDNTFDSLLEGRYLVTKRLAEFARSLSFASDSDTKIVVINHAIALKELEQTDDVENILSSQDWSACSLRFRIALHLLRDELLEVATLLPKAVAAGEVEQDHVLTWPLFKGFRQSPQYRVLSARLRRSVGGPLLNGDSLAFSPWAGAAAGAQVAG